ncbi:hypothetical protein BDW68DRAFT_34437 [Aspergillus falconensis]
MYSVRSRFVFRISAPYSKQNRGHCVRVYTTVREVIVFISPFLGVGYIVVLTLLGPGPFLRKIELSELPKSKHARMHLDLSLISTSSIRMDVSNGIAFK